MKTNVELEREIVVGVKNEIGVLSRLTTALAEAKINIKAICGYEVDNDAHIRLVTQDTDKAVNVLKEAGFKASAYDAVRCEVAPHLLHPEALSLMGGMMEVENNYWCASAHSGEHAVLYFSPKDNVHLARKPLA